MATVHRSYRLEAGLLAQVESWAADNGMRSSEAVAALLERGLAPCEEYIPQGADNNAAAEVEALRANLEDLRAQIAAKDRQLELALSMATNAQALQVAAEARALEAARETPLSVEDDDEDQKAEDVDSGAVGPSERPTGAVLSDDDGAGDTGAEAVKEKRLTWRERLARWILGE